MRTASVLIAFGVTAGSVWLTGCASAPPPAAAEIAAPPRAGPDFDVVAASFIEALEKGDAQDSDALFDAANSREEGAVAADLLATELALQAASAGEWALMKAYLERIGDETVRTSVETRLREAGLPVGKD